VTPPTWLFFPATGAPAPPWEPSDLTSLIAWYKADAISGLSNNDPVGTWSDSSTSGWDATASSDNRPTYITNAQNSLPIVRFSGSNHLNLGSTDLFRNVGGGTVYAVAKDSATTTRGTVLHINTGNPVAGQTRAVIESGGSGGASLYEVGGRRLDSDTYARALGSTVTGAWTMVGGLWNYAAASLAIYRNGSIDATNPSFQTPGLTSNTSPTAAGTNLGAARDNNSNAFNGDIAEIVVVHEALSTGDRQKLEGYLAHKWGLTGNLPGASPGPEHPYKTNPP
jgi:hypothetical protein